MTFNTLTARVINSTRFFKKKEYKISMKNFDEKYIYYINGILKWHIDINDVGDKII